MTHYDVLDDISPDIYNIMPTWLGCTKHCYDPLWCIRWHKSRHLVENCYLSIFCVEEVSNKPLHTVVLGNNTSIQIIYTDKCLSSLNYLN